MLRFDTEERSLEVRGFSDEQTEIAMERSNSAETEYAERPQLQVALVTVENVKKLKEAYLNYGNNAEGFVNERILLIEPPVGNEEGSMLSDAVKEILFLNYEVDL